MAQNPKVALTFWWTATEVQVRIQGLANQIPATDADKYFRERDREGGSADTLLGGAPGDIRYKT